MAAIPESATRFMAGLVECARQRKKTIVFPEGLDPRVREAAARLARDGVVRPVLLGPKPADAPPGVTFLDPAHAAAVAKYAAIYYERRRAKGITEVEAAGIARDPLYFAALMVSAGVDQNNARVLARLGLAVTRGLLLDLLASGDSAGVTDAFELFTRLLEQAAAGGTSGG